MQDLRPPTRTGRHPGTRRSVPLSTLTGINAEAGQFRNNWLPS